MIALSTRAGKALAILAAGGRFDHVLERNRYTGREKFAHRLHDAAGRTVGGFGFAAFSELERAGAIVPNYWTSASTEYVARVPT